MKECVRTILQESLKYSKEKFTSHLFVLLSSNIFLFMQKRITYYQQMRVLRKRTKTLYENNGYLNLHTFFYSSKKLHQL